MKIQSLIVLFCFILIAWAFNHSEKPRTTNKTWNKYPQEYMKQVSVWSYTEEGNLKNYLSAEYWAYLPEQKASKLEKPHLTVYKPDATEWQIDAKKATVAQPTIGTIEQVELQESVVLKRPQTDKAFPIRVETEVLRYRPHQEFAETDKEITLTKPDLKITGVGMHADLKTNSVKLLDKVQSEFVITK